MKKYLIMAFCGLSLSLRAQTEKVGFLRKPEESKIDVRIGDQYFSSFVFSEKLEKPILYPLIAASGATVTRGFPLAPRNQERTDHPHHVGLWLNYESVNGLDFWNNSYQIPVAKKSKYGWIRKVKIGQVSGGNQEGRLTYTANWERQDGHVLLKEETTFIFSGTAHTRTIDRITTLKAVSDTVHFKDVKDGMLGLRVTKELEMPSTQEVALSDSHGNLTKVSASSNGANGNYLTSTGKTGNEAWGTRADWCLLYGVKDKQDLSVAIMDHPQNPGYPTYWHARDYGLFAANPLGQQVFSNGKENFNLTLSPAESVTFRYRILITSSEKNNADHLNEVAKAFGEKYK